MRRAIVVILMVALAVSGPAAPTGHGVGAAVTAFSPGATPVVSLEPRPGWMCEHHRWTDGPVPHRLTLRHCPIL